MIPADLATLAALHALCHGVTGAVVNTTRWGVSLEMRDPPTGSTVISTQPTPAEAARACATITGRADVVAMLDAAVDAFATALD